MLFGPALAVSAMLFVIGVAGVLVRRNAIVIFMCVELMLNAREPDVSWRWPSGSAWRGRSSCSS